MVGGVNYEPDDLASSQYNGTGFGQGQGQGQGPEEGLDDVNEEETDRKRAAGIRSVFNARDNNRNKKKRNWNYLDNINTGPGGGFNRSTASVDDGDSAGIVHSSGYAVREGVSDNDNKYHRMAVQEVRCALRFLPLGASFLCLPSLPLQASLYCLYSLLSLYPLMIII